MEVAEVGSRYSALDTRCRRASRARRSAAVKAHGALLSADLGGSSKYSNANLED